MRGPQPQRSVAFSTALTRAHYEREKRIHFAADVWERFCGVETGEAQQSKQAMKEIVAVREEKLLLTPYHYSPIVADLFELNHTSK